MAEPRQRPGSRCALPPAALVGAAPIAAGDSYAACLPATPTAAWYGGRWGGVGITSIILGMSLAMSAQFAQSPGNIAVVGLLVVWLVEALRSARRRAQAGAAPRCREEAGSRLLFEANPHPMWVYDVETLRFLAVNEAAVRDYGYGRDDFLAMTVSDIGPPEDFPGLCGRAPGLTGKTSLDAGGRRHLRRDGTIIDVEISSGAMEFEGRTARLVAAVDVTARLRAEQALRRSEIRLRRVVDPNLIGTAFVDGQSEMHADADACLGLARCSIEDLKARQVRLQALLGKASFGLNGIPAGGPETVSDSACLDAQCVCKDGILVSALPGVAGMEQGADEAACFTLEVTRSRHAERDCNRLGVVERAALDAARVSEGRYRLLAQSIPQIIWMAGEDGGLHYSNPRWAQYTGLDKLRSMGQGWLSALHGDDARRFRLAWDRAKKAGEGLALDLRLRRLDGRYRWHLLQAFPSRERVGRPNRWLGTFTDIDDQKRAEGALSFLAEAGAMLSSSLDYQTILASLARLAVPHVADLCRIDVIEGDAVVRVGAAGMGAGEAEGGTAPEASHPAARVLKTGRLEWASRDADPARWAELIGSGPREALGGEGLTSYICVPMEARGATLGAISLAMAGSGRSYGQDDLALAQQLARRAALAVDNARLYRDADRARRDAEAANRTKDRFLAVLSHELRTPLTPVLMAATALMDDPDTPYGLRPILEMMRRNVELEARLIGDLLDVARVGAGKLHLSRVLTDAHALIWLALGMCGDDLRASGLEVEVDLAAEAHHVLGDQDRLQQVVWNLVKNAAKFTPSGGRIRIRTANEPGAQGGSGPWLVLEVQDTGGGIGPDLLPKVFDAFEQGDEGTTRRHGGLGLGLAISRAVAEAHGGRLRASSGGRGLGSTFTMDLPTALAEVGEPPAPADDETRGADGPLRILLVEDNRDSLKNLTWALDRLGYAVMPAASLAAAREALACSTCDLIVSDIQLPDGTGLELMQEVARTGEAPGIALSGYGSEGDVRESLEAGFSEHLVKPITFSALDAAIRRVAPANSRGAVAASVGC